MKEILRNHKDCGWGSTNHKINLYQRSMWSLILSCNLISLWIYRLPQRLKNTIVKYIILFNSHIIDRACINNNVPGGYRPGSAPFICQIVDETNDRNRKDPYQAPKGRFNKTCICISLKSAVQHRQLSYCYPLWQPCSLSRGNHSGNTFKCMTHVQFC